MLFLLIFVALTFQQYQQCTHLHGNDGVSVPQIYGVTGVFNISNTIGGMLSPTLFSIKNNEEILLLFGGRIPDPTKETTIHYSDEVWKFSLSLNQWKLMKGRKGIQFSLFGEIGAFSESNKIGSLCYHTGWINEEKDVVTIFGGASYPYYTNYYYAINLNEIWRYNITSNLYAVDFISIYYTDSNAKYNNINSYYFLEGEFNSTNRISGRNNPTAVKLNEDEVVVIGGFGYYASSVPDQFALNDLWIYSTVLKQWKFMKGNIFDQDQALVYGETNVYSPSNTLGRKSLHQSVLINEEEIMVFGGYSTNFNGYGLNIVHKYNITSNMWKYCSGEKYSLTFESPNAKLFNREYDSENAIGGRFRHVMYKFNDDEVLVFGGYGWGQKKHGLLVDLWLYNIKTNQWRFNGKEKAKYPDRIKTIAETTGYSDETLMGGEREPGSLFSPETKELFILGGYTYAVETRGAADDMWRFFFGNICNNLEESDPNICSNRGSCIGYNTCDCIDDFYGSDCELFKCYGILSNETDVCSTNGVCYLGKCACFESSPYTNPDCSINKELQTVVENLWIIISVPILIIISVSIIIIILIGLIFVFFKLRSLLKKVEGIEDVDLILQEAKLEQSNSNPKIDVDKSLFEVNYEDIKLLKVLGEGASQSTVYLAEWKGNYCAYKGFKVEMGDTSDYFFEEFEKEVKIYSSINHPSILQFFGACVNLPKIGILVQFCDNGDIPTFFSKYSFSNKKRYGIKGKLRIIKEIASGMDYLHSISVLHRDLKPENVLIDENENAKIMDFGLSRLTDNNPEKTKTQRIGTSYYMAPEVFKGGKYSNKCDVFSWAILAYVVITENFLPFGTKVNEGTILKKVSTDNGFRPTIDEVDFQDCKFMIPLIKKNWDGNPETRNSFKEIFQIMSKEKIGTKNDRKKSRRNEKSIKLDEKYLKAYYVDQEKYLKELEQLAKLQNKTINELK